MSELGKVPPQATDIEVNVLGACMQDRHGLLVSCRMLSADDFYLQTHRILFATIKDMYTKGQGVDLSTVYQALGSKIEEIGGISYLTQLTDKVSSTAHIETWCGYILDKSIKRGLIAHSTQTLKEAFADDRAALEIVTDSHRSFMELTAAKAESDKDHESIAQQAVAEMTTPSDNGISGIPLTGMYEVDYRMNGGEAGDLIIIAARPSMGKSMLANTIVCNLDRRDIKCLMWGLEMDEGQNFKMYTSNMGGIDYDDVKRGRLSPTDARLSDVYDRFTNRKNVHMIGKVGVNVGQMRAKITELVAQYGIKVVVIDHGRLIRKNMGAPNDVEEISLITGILKQTAKELMIPIVLLWQLSRASEKEANRRPALDHLRGSGTLEEDADKVVFIYRDQYYSSKAGIDSDVPKDLAELIFAKVRGGETGTELSRFRPDRAGFEKWESSDDWSNLPTVEIGF